MPSPRRSTDRSNRQTPPSQRRETSSQLNPTANSYYPTASQPLDTASQLNPAAPDYQSLSSSSLMQLYHHPSSPPVYPTYGPSHRRGPNSDREKRVLAILKKHICPDASWLGIANLLNWAFFAEELYQESYEDPSKGHSAPRDHAFGPQECARVWNEMVRVDGNGTPGSIIKDVVGLDAVLNEEIQNVKRSVNRHNNGQKRIGAKVDRALEYEKTAFSHPYLPQ